MRKFNLDIIMTDRNFENLKCGVKPTDLTGKIFGRLTVLRFAGFVKKCRIWETKCLCGKIRLIKGEDLTRKDGRGVKSCGCIHSEIVRKNETTHGMSKSRLFSIWHGIHTRCLNTKDPSFPRYGGRGIKIDNRWLGVHGFENFRDDTYESYLRHIEEFGENNTSIDRWPNVNGNYEPNNVRWATRKEQSRNREISSNTKDYDLHLKNLHNIRKLLARIIGANYKTSPTMERYLGCNLSAFRKHLESQFTEGMTWNNYGKGKGKWCIDHIIPCNRFDFTKEEDKLECFNFINLRPRWYTINFSERFKIIKREKIK